MRDPIGAFPGIPLIESPTFNSVLDRMELTDSEREIARNLNRNGYAVFDFPDPDVDFRIERIRSRFAPEFGIDDLDPASIKSPANGRVQDACLFDEDVRSIASNRAVLSLLSRLYGRRAFPFQTLNFPVGTEQPVHTDIVHFSSIPERFMCGVWLAMEDIDPRAGPLCYVPGSHKWPVLSNALIGRRGWETDEESAQLPYQDAWNALIAEHGAATETFLARKGQALIWCANLLHGGSARTDPTRTRWSQVTHYYFDDCIYYTPAFSDEALGRLYLRQPVDVSNGTQKRNLYLGTEIRAAVPAEEPESLWRTIKRKASA